MLLCYYIAYIIQYVPGIQNLLLNSVGSGTRNWSALVLLALCTCDLAQHCPACVSQQHVYVDAGSEGDGPEAGLVLDKQVQVEWRRGPLASVKHRRLVLSWRILRLPQREDQMTSLWKTEVQVRSRHPRSDLTENGSSP